MNKESVTGKNAVKLNAPSIDEPKVCKKTTPVMNECEADAVWEDISRAHIYMLRMVMENRPRKK